MTYSPEQRRKHINSEMGPHTMSSLGPELEREVETEEDMDHEEETTASNVLRVLYCCSP